MGEVIFLKLPSTDIMHVRRYQYIRSNIGLIVIIVRQTMISFFKRGRTYICFLYQRMYIVLYLTSNNWIEWFERIFRLNKNTIYVNHEIIVSKTCISSSIGT